MLHCKSAVCFLMLSNQHEDAKQCLSDWCHTLCMKACQRHLHGLVIPLLWAPRVTCLCAHVALMYIRNFCYGMQSSRQLCFTAKNLGIYMRMSRHAWFRLCFGLIAWSLCLRLCLALCYGKWQDSSHYQWHCLCLESAEAWCGWECLHLFLVCHRLNGIVF